MKFFSDLFQFYPTNFIKQISHKTTKHYNAHNCQCKCIVKWKEKHKTIIISVPSVTETDHLFYRKLIIMSMAINITCNQPY